MIFDVNLNWSELRHCLINMSGLIDKLKKRVARSKIYAKVDIEVLDLLICLTRSHLSENKLLYMKDYPYVDQSMIQFLFHISSLRDDPAFAPGQFRSTRLRETLDPARAGNTH